MIKGTAGHELQPRQRPVPVMGRTKKARLHTLHTKEGATAHKRCGAHYTQQEAWCTYDALQKDARLPLEGYTQDRAAGLQFMRKAPPELIKQ